MENIDEAVLMATSGVEIEDIALELGASVDTIRKWLHQQGVIDAIREQRNKRLIKAYRLGWSIHKIARVFGISQGTLYNVLRANDVTLRRDRVSRTYEIESCIIADYTAGLKTSAICAKYKCSITFLYSTLDKYGVPKRRR